MTMHGSMKLQRRRISTAASLTSSWEERPSPATVAMQGVVLIKESGNERFLQ